jgi:glutaredoxin 3
VALVRIYTTLICPYCIRAKMLLRARGIEYEEIDVTGDRAARQWLAELTGRRTVPQIFIRDEAIGGFDELHALSRSGELPKKLAGPPEAPAGSS